MLDEEEIEGLIEAGQYETAATLLETALEKSPNNVQVLRLLAWVRILQRRTVEANALLRRAEQVPTIDTRAAERARAMLRRHFDPPDIENQDDDGLSDDDIAYSLRLAADSESDRKHFRIGSDDEGEPAQQSAAEDEVVTRAQPASVEPEEPLSAYHDQEGDDLDESEEASEPSEDIDYAALVDEDDDESDEQELFLFLEEPSESSPQQSGHQQDDQSSPEWLHSLDDLYEFEDEPERPELQQDLLESETIARSERALQHAIDLGQRYNWDEDGIRLLAEIFTTYWWVSTKRSMQRELERGLEVEELRLAYGLREIWRKYQEFALSYQRFPYSSLSWPLALAIVRSYGSYPEVEEMEMFLIQLFLEWSDSRSLGRHYPSFYAYVSARTVSPFNHMLVSPAASLEGGYDAMEDDFLAGAYLGFPTEERELLRDLGLLADPPIDYLSTRVFVDWPAFEKMSKEH